DRSAGSHADAGAFAAGLIASIMRRPAGRRPTTSHAPPFPLKVDARMADEVTKPVPATTQSLEVVIVDPHNATVQYVDWIVTGGVGPAAGMVNVVLAALDYTVVADGKPQAIVQSRLRMSVTVAMNLHRFLGGILFAAEPSAQSTKLN